MRQRTDELIGAGNPTATRNERHVAVLDGAIDLFDAVCLSSAIAGFLVGVAIRIDGSLGIAWTVVLLLCGAVGAFLMMVCVLLRIDRMLERQWRSRAS